MREEFCAKHNTAFLPTSCLLSQSLSPSLPSCFVPGCRRDSSGPSACAGGSAPEGDSFIWKCFGWPLAKPNLTSPVCHLRREITPSALATLAEFLCTLHYITTLLSTIPTTHTAHKTTACTP